MSKAEDVRQYLTKHPKAQNKDVAEATGASPQQVSNLRKKMGQTVGATATATKPAAAKTGPKSGAKRGPKTAAATNSGSFDNLKQVRKLARELGSTAEVRALCDQVDELDAE